MSIFASRWRQACEGALSFLSEKKGVGKAMGRECCVAGYSNSSQKCSSCSYSVVFFHLFCSVLATTTPLGEKRGAELAAKSARGAFFQSSSVRLGHQKKSPDWQRRCSTLYTTGSFPSPLLYGPSTLWTSGKVSENESGSQLCTFF